MYHLCVHVVFQWGNKSLIYIASPLKLCKSNLLRPYLCATLKHVMHDRVCTKYKTSSHLYGIVETAATCINTA